jgi:hypothetical protein
VTEFALPYLKPICCLKLPYSSSAYRSNNIAWRVFGLGSVLNASLWLHPPQQMANDPQSENMMRIAIAGSGGLARIFANYINATVHPFIILSRQV